MSTLTINLLAEARKRGKLIAHDEEIKYARFREDFRSILRGTVVLENATRSGKHEMRIIWGFPHITRIFTLENGMGKNMHAETFYVEEKIDGFNLRIAKVNGNIFAFSRGGFIDWFATEKICEMNLENFFKDYPGAVLCGEMIGNTPYTKPIRTFDTRLMVFDIDEGDGTYVKPREKFELLKKYAIDSVPLIGVFRKSELSKLKQTMLTVLKKKKEGIIIKSEDRREIVKYVTPYADIEDIARNMSLMFDMPSGFFIQRILRSAFFLREFELDREHYAKELGSACYLPLIEKLKELGNGDRISEEYEVIIKNQETWNRILKHMSREVKIEIVSRKPEGNKTRIKFKKIYKKTDRELRSYLLGKGVTD